MTRIINLDLDEAILDAQLKNPTSFRTERGGEHERDAGCIGASSLPMCIRKLAFQRNNRLRPPSRERPWGVFDRGAAIEDMVVKRLRQAIEPFGLILMRAGEDQLTIERHPLSATPDGILYNPTNNRVVIPLADGQIELEPGGSCVIEFKSAAQTVDISKPKPAHIQQAQIQIALIWTSEQNEYKPLEGILMYTRADDLNQRVMFKVPQPEPGFLAAQNRRAQMLIDMPDPQDHMPEGRISGECVYCEYTEACGAAIIKSIPRTETGIPTDAVPVLDALVNERNSTKEQIEQYTTKQKEAEEKIREFLRSHHTKQAATDFYKVRWFARQGSRRLLSRKVRELYPDIERDDECWAVGSPVNTLTITKRK